MIPLLDEYERKARLLPALIAGLPLPIAATVLTPSSVPWYSSLGFGAGLWAILGVGLAYFARAAGQRLEGPLVSSCGGSPVERWLRPSDTTHSSAMKSKWRGAIRSLTGLAIPAAIKEPGDGAEAAFDRTAGDAVYQLRHRLRGLPAARMVQVHNVDYGFYRNLAGLNGAWVVLSSAGVVAVAVSFGSGQRPFVGLGLEVVSLVASLLAIVVLPGQVRHAAERYAESLLAAAVLVSDEEARAEGSAKSSRSPEGDRGKSQRTELG